MSGLPTGQNGKPIAAEQVIEAIRRLAIGNAEMMKAMKEAKRERDRLVFLVKDLQRHVRSVSEFRQDPGETLSEMPFGVIDYHGMDDLNQRCEAAIVAAGWARDPDGSWHLAPSPGGEGELEH